MDHRYIDDELSEYERAFDELKRVDHLVYVSLKYTRTVDVIKNILERMVASFEHIIQGILKTAEQKGQIFEIPNNPSGRIRDVKQCYGNEASILEMINFYIYLRKLHNAEYSAAREFRRHVTMTAKMPDGEIIEVNIDVISEYYSRCKKILEQVRPFFKH
jgi:hypothetical protein